MDIYGCFTSTHEYAIIQLKRFSSQKNRGSTTIPSRGAERLMMGFIHPGQNLSDCHGNPWQSMPTMRRWWSMERIPMDTIKVYKSEFCFRTSFGQRDGGVLKMSTPFGRICAAGRRGSDPLCHVRLQGFVPHRSDCDIRKMPPAWNQWINSSLGPGICRLDSWGGLSCRRQELLEKCWESLVQIHLNDPRQLWMEL